MKAKTGIKRPSLKAALKQLENDWRGYLLGRTITGFSWNHRAPHPVIDMLYLDDGRVLTILPNGVLRTMVNPPKPTKRSF